MQVHITLVSLSHLENENNANLLMMQHRKILNQAWFDGTLFAAISNTSPHISRLTIITEAQSRRYHNLCQVHEATVTRLALVQTWSRPYKYCVMDRDRYLNINPTKLFLVLNLDPEID